MKKIFCLIIILVLTGCTAKKPGFGHLNEVRQIKDNERVVKDNQVESKELTNIAPLEIYPTVKEIEINDLPKINTGELLDNALKDARQKPEAVRFFNAVTQYDYIPGSIYQVYTAPLKVTMISFEPGEKMTSPPQGGDTVRWQINTMNSTDNGDEQQHLTIKPMRAGLKNNMIITTNKGRTYLLELVSFKSSFMAAVAWNYPKSNLILSDNNITKEPEWSLEKLNFNYKVINKRGKPAWLPLKVFDDGQKTFIQFDASINQAELPALFIVSSETNTQLVNYRYKNNCMVIDRLFSQAELKLGLKKPELVRIKRVG